MSRPPKPVIERNMPIGAVSVARGRFAALSLSLFAKRDSAGAESRGSIPAYGGADP